MSDPIPTAPPLINDQTLTAHQPCVNHSVVVFPLRKASDYRVVQVLFSDFRLSPLPPGI